MSLSINIFLIFNNEPQAGNNLHLRPEMLLFSQKSANFHQK